MVLKRKKQIFICINIRRPKSYTFGATLFTDFCEIIYFESCDFQIQKAAYKGTIFLLSSKPKFFDDNFIA